MSQKPASLPAPDRIPLDVLFVLSDLLSGKSIPVLVGIARLPVDQFLAGAVLSLGALAGALFSAYAGLTTDRGHALARWNRVVQACYGLFLSLALALSLARGLHYQRGVILSLAPAFCLVAQPLSRRESAALLAFLVFVPALAIGLSAPAPRGEGPPAVLPTVLRGLNPSSPLEEEAQGVWEVLGRALQLFVLAFYASVQHALPAQAAEEGFQPSPALLALPVYAVFVGLVGALGRLCVWYLVCFVQDNALHVMLENDLSRGGWDWAACVAYTVVLLYAAAGAASQIREQLLPALLAEPAPRLKFAAGVLALAALFRMRDPDALFVATSVLAGVSVATAGLTLESMPQWSFF